MERAAQGGALLFSVQTPASQRATARSPASLTAGVVSEASRADAHGSSSASTLGGACSQIAQGVLS
jgi:hypothetical protein